MKHIDDQLKSWGDDNDNITPNDNIPPVVFDKENSIPLGKRVIKFKEEPEDRQEAPSDERLKIFDKKFKELTKLVIDEINKKHEDAEQHMHAKFQESEEKKELALEEADRIREELSKKNPWEFYPPNRNEETDPYNVEFHRGGWGANTWTLFKSSEIHSREEWEKITSGVSEYKNLKLFMSRFGHPYQLGSGALDGEESIGMNKAFMRYMVDALNEKYKRESCPPPKPENPAMGRTLSPAVGIKISEDIKEVVRKRKEQREVPDNIIKPVEFLNVEDMGKLRHTMGG